MAATSTIAGSLVSTAGTAINAVGAVQQVNSLLGIGGPPGAASNIPNDDVSITVTPAGTGQQVSGWTRVRITRGVERLPGDFDIEMTEKYPGQVANMLVQPGFPCTVKIGPDLVITGYVDKVLPSIDPENHIIRITGRSKCQDLVDCSAIWPYGQISGCTALDIATKLAAPYNITVTPPPAGVTLPIVDQIQLIYTDTAIDIIDRSCKNSGLLYYDDENGNLVLSQVGTVAAASGFEQGTNVIRAAGTFTMDQRYQQMNVRVQSMGYLTDAGNQSSIVYSGPDSSGIADANVPRFRNKNLICDFGGIGLPWATLRWQWEVHRRFGRSFKIDVTIDSWRDSAGKLWTPNTTVKMNIPACRMNNVVYVISEVTFQRDEENGTTARIIAMPAEAYQVEPLKWIPVPVAEVGAPMATPGRANSATATSTSATPAVTATSPDTSDFTVPNPIPAANATPMSIENATKIINLYEPDGTVK